MRRLVIAALCGVFCSCASAPIPKRTPTVESPDVGCILPTLAQRGSVSGKMLPEIVLVVGETPIDDGARWKVLRGPDFDPKKWEPHEKAEIIFGARCGSSTLQRDFDAERSSSSPP